MSTDIPVPRTFERSDAATALLERHLPSGVSSGIRRRAQPILFERGEGATLVDIDGNVFIDCVLALGPVIIGHSEPSITSRLHKQLDKVLVTGSESPRTPELLNTLVRWIPCAEHVLFANTGSEAVHLALRIARATTGRGRVLRFEGHYHGWIDPAYTNGAGHVGAPLADGTIEVAPNGPGQLDVSDAMVVAAWNDIPSFDVAIDAWGDDLAAVIMEPIAFNAGGLRPYDGYLEHVREVCSRRGILLIFDEVVSGFRLAKGGAQEVLAITPDIATFAKAIAPGIPLAMVAGTAAAFGAVRDGRLGGLGTYTGNSLAVEAALASAEFIDSTPDFHAVLAANGEHLRRVLEQAIAERDLPLQVNATGSVVNLFWDTTGDRRTVASIATGDPTKVAAIIERMAHHGVFALPRGAFFLSYRHTHDHLDEVGRAFAAALDDLISDAAL